MPRTGSEVLARVAWSRLAEPGDPHAGATVAELGGEGALDWLRHAAGHPGNLGPATRAAITRWAPRLDDLNPERDLAEFERIGGHVLIPGDDTWPNQLADLGSEQPHILWVRGNSALLTQQSIGVVGSRSATRYGEAVTGELGFGLSDAGKVVISGGAYGIDAAAHRSALLPDHGAGTVAVLAGGVDRPYPAGNAVLLEAVAAQGALVSEMAPGSAPTRHRFLARNRVIAALARAVVVVEAAHRSGALSTAHHAARLLRPLGAVPGPVTSVSSAGCHRLLRDGLAVCVTGVNDVLELASPAGLGIASTTPEVHAGLLDGLDPLAARVLDALPVRAAAEVSALVRACGLAPLEVLTGLGSLELAGRVRRAGARWARVTS